MIRLVPSICAALLFAPLTAAAKQPVNRRIIARAIYHLDRTETGRSYDRLRAAPEPLELHFDFTGPARLHYLEYPSAANGRKRILRFHSHLRPAWPQYVSWVFVQGLVHFQADALFRSAGGGALPVSLLEVDQLAFVKAMRHWDELGAPAGKDLAKDERFRGAENLAIRMRAGVDELHALWQSDFSAFLAAVAARRGALGYPTETAAGYAAAPGRTAAERAAARELGAFLHEALEAEARSWAARNTAARRSRAAAARSVLRPGPMPVLKQLQALSGS